jgi:hypothetical protein
MKQISKGLTFILISLLLISMIACGSKTSDVGLSDTSTVSSGTASGGVTPDANASVDSLIGSWVQVEDATLFANITKTETGYAYEDNDSKYTAAFLDGVLTVNVTEMSAARVYIDAKSGELVLEYQGGETKFKKK